MLQDRGGDHVAKDQEHGGRRYDKEGNPLERRAEARAERLGAGPVVTGDAGHRRHSAADTEIPNRLTGSV